MGLYWAHPDLVHRLPAAGPRDPQSELVEVAEEVAMSHRYCPFNICLEGLTAAWDIFRIHISSEAPLTERNTYEETTALATGLRRRTSYARR